MNITSIDHVVLTVKDVSESVNFYESVLGMTAEIFDTDRVALTFGNQKINLHTHGKEFEPKADKPTPGAADLCFITETQLDLAMEHVRNNGINILQGPGTRTGAIGKLISFYFRDPDRNLIEVANHAIEKEETYI